MVDGNNGSALTQNLLTTYVPPELHDVDETDATDELRQRYAAGITENRVTFKTGDITDFSADAIVCPWVSERPEDGHYSQKIYTAGGPLLHAELQAVWPSPRVATHSVLTNNHGIRTCKHIIHVLEPPPPPPLTSVHRRHESPYWSPHKMQSLRDTIIACLIMAISLDCRTIAIPPLGIRSVFKPVETRINPPAGGISGNPRPEPANQSSPEPGTQSPGSTGNPPTPIRRWEPERAAETVLEAIGDFRARSPFRDRLEEIIFLFEDIDDWGGDELGSYRRERAWAVEWEEPWKVPRLLQGRVGRNEPDQREWELSGPNSRQSTPVKSSNSGFESDHASDIEPARPVLSGPIPTEILNHVYAEIPVPLGVYVQFDSLFIPTQLGVLDQHQPAVYGYIRFVSLTAGNVHDGWEIDISRTGRRGRWVLGARISDRTIDGRLVGRPLDRDAVISLDDPRLRFNPTYRNMLNPNLPETRQALIARYLRDFQLHDYSTLRKRWRKRQREGLKARNWRHAKIRRWRRLDRRRNRRWSARELRNIDREDRREGQHERREAGEDVTSVVSDDELDTPPSSPPLVQVRGPRTLRRRGQRWETHEGYLRTKELRTESSVSSGQEEDEDEDEDEDGDGDGDEGGEEKGGERLERREGGGGQVVTGVELGTRAQRGGA